MSWSAAVHLVPAPMPPLPLSPSGMIPQSPWPPYHSTSRIHLLQTSTIQISSGPPSQISLSPRQPRSIGGVAEIDGRRLQQQECGRGALQVAGGATSMPTAATHRQPPHLQDKLTDPISHASIMKFFLWPAVVFNFFVSSEITTCSIGLCLHGLSLLFG
jgi:hypothetical protein